jgi:hypothetical protein
MNDPGELRASDAEREAVVERLRDASVEGRLTLAELTERTEAAYLAATHAELAQVTADLPDTGARPAPAPAYPEAPAKKRRWYVAVMGDTKRRGKWRVDEEIGAVAVMGDVTIDLREAEVRGNEVEIVAVAVMGDVKIIVPDGVDVDLSGVTIMGDKKVQVVEAPPGQKVPVIRVRAYVVMGDVKVIGDSRADPIKRAWFAWSEWWWERRGVAGEDDHDYRRLRQGDREGLRELRRDTRDQLRQSRREAHDRLREVRRGGAPRPPRPPEPPRW